MKRLLIALWPEGVFIVVGTGLLAVGASFISTAGPWLVTGAIVLAAGLALTLAPNRSR